MSACAPRWTMVAEQIARAGAALCCAVLGIGEAARLQRQAAAADALREPCLQSLQLLDPCVDASRPAPRQLCPIRPIRHAVVRKSGEFRSDLVERQANLL